MTLKLNKKKMSIGIYYDKLVGKGGAERVMIYLANYLNADLITSGYDPTINKWIKIKTRVINLGNIFFNINKTVGYVLEAPIRFWLNRTRYSYDINIFSGRSAVFASIKGKNNIWFCHCPNRDIYDFYEKKKNKMGILKKLLFLCYRAIFYTYDQYVVKNNFSQIVVNSINVQNRVRKYYNMDSIVIYPPTQTHLYKFHKVGDFYLSVSSLCPNKRIDIIAKSFLRMTDKKLIIVGNGPEKNKIKAIIKGSRNIQLLTNADDNTLRSLYSDCIATIYIPVDEDFGLVPIESMASGKPCIASNEGGCKETVIHGKTGLLIEPTEENLIKAVKMFDIKRAKMMKKYCIKWARNFDISVCVKKWYEEIRKFESR